MGIYSCKDCDKRFPGCHSSCPDYIAEKEKHDKEKAERDKENFVRYGLYNQRDTVVRKYYKSIKRHSGYRA